MEDCIHNKVNQYTVVMNSLICPRIVYHYQSKNKHESAGVDPAECVHASLMQRGNFMITY